MRLLMGLVLVAGLLLTVGCHKRQAKTEGQDVLTELLRDDSREARPQPSPLPQPPPTQPTVPPAPKTIPKPPPPQPVPAPPPRPAPNTEPRPLPKRAYKPEDRAARERVLAAVQAQTGGYTVDEDDPAQPVIEINLSGARRAGLTDAGLPSLEGLPNLQRLRLSFIAITDASLVKIGQLTSLEILELNDNKRITDAGLMHLKGLVNLKRLDVRATSVTDAGVTEFRKVLPGVVVHR